MLAGLPTDLLIDGDWRPSQTERRFDVHNPATGEVLASVADASPEEGILALDAAVRAQTDWARTSPRARGEILRRAFELVTERADQFATVMTLEMGKPLHEARAEVTYGAEFLRWFSEEAPRINGRYGLNPEGTGNMLVSRRPVGPCFFITPWNFPLAMATRKVAPALAAGCTVVLKPAALTPLTALIFARTLQDAGLPDGVLNVVTTSRSTALSAPILADTRLRKLSFTGSTQVGVALLKQAADNVLRTSMELGGNAPFIVFEDADLDAAVTGAMQAKFRNIGQACTAANRFLVQDSIAGQFADAVAARIDDMVVGDGMEPGTTIGPLINTDAVHSCARLVEDAVARGARLVRGGSPLPVAPGTYFPPTLLVDVQPGSEILEQEIFGPVLAISTFTDEADAVRRANDTPYGLASYVFTADARRASRMVDELDAGMMGLNVGVISNAAAPFGGVKQSGLGREGSAEGIGEFLETKYTLTAV
ncbi:NAD-dependent succinate-semialdehyde dehydrogenase [Microbacterium sp. CFH 31415]|uniref:NAD-dependent succinate-semialdehyde dehydrogenase n=1 Tax=Microbacterium sp. CFH 31415 TaxID=2921732 RepID=UPI001F143049|nr:NAD-dependent succinate-semialdehyde dehydrogenase [Microbacterium sp. CFH 31415]MCH6230574.1 NAD-dependent succinate-semialdehyde dehydrogenase [Microbacterium sp. CFH 31415]